MHIETLKYYIQSANVNFLYGSGLSRPFLSILGNIEKWLTELNEKRHREGDNVPFTVVEASILKLYFESVMYPNVAPAGANYDATINEYRRFLRNWNGLINKRSNRLVGKQSDIPVFNLIKIHGSINWKSEADVIKNDLGLPIVQAVRAALDGIDAGNFISTTKIDPATGDATDKTLAEMITEAEAKGLANADVFNPFFEQYRKLVMINPTKRKFKESVIDHHFYELMRQYSNNLEKENTLLLVSGFSFADEHIADITLRAANTNPTLHIVVFGFNDGDGTTIKNNLKLHDVCLNNNVEILTPTVFKSHKDQSQEEKYRNFAAGVTQFDFTTVNNLFELISQGIVVYGR